MTTNSEPTASEQTDEFELDPVFLSSIRESRWILLMWVGCFAWTLTACLTLGYPDTVDPKTFATVLGIPAWVAWGIGLPWLLANIVTIWFCLTQMEDADLEAGGRDSGEPSLASSGDGNAD